MSALDLIHATHSVNYAPLDPETSVSEKRVQELIDTPTAAKLGTVDFVNTPPPGAANW